MSLRLPQNLEPAFGADKASRAMDAFHHEVLAEKAASLGRAGRSLAKKLAMLAEAPVAVDRRSLLKDAADAAHAYFIQRELCGLYSHQNVIEYYDIPKDVLARMGAS